MNSTKDDLIIPEVVLRDNSCTINGNPAHFNNTKEGETLVCAKMYIGKHSPDKRERKQPEIHIATQTPSGKGFLYHFNNRGQAVSIIEATGRILDFVPTYYLVTDTANTQGDMALVLHRGSLGLEHFGFETSRTNRNYSNFYNEVAGRAPTMFKPHLHLDWKKEIVSIKFTWGNVLPLPPKIDTPKIGEIKIKEESIPHFSINWNRTQELHERIMTL